MDASVCLLLRGTFLAVPLAPPDLQEGIKTDG